MLLNAFSQEMQTRGCVSNDKLFCGTYQGLPFSVFYIKGTDFRTEFFLSVKFEQFVPPKAYAEIKEQMSGHAFVVEEQKSYPWLWMFGVLRIVDVTLLHMRIVVEKDQDFGQIFDMLLGSVLQKSNSNNLTLPKNCHICKKPNCNFFASKGKTYVPVHKTCVEEKAKKSLLNAQKNPLSPNYPLGILGALLGGLVGMLPSLFASVFLNYISTILCALIPYCAYWGYRIVRGKMTKASTVIISAVSLLIAPVFFYFYVNLSILMDGKDFIRPDIFFSFVFFSDIVFLGLFMRVLMSVAVGAVIVFALLKHTNMGFSQDPNYSLASLRPIPGMEAQPLGQQPPPEQNAVQ